MVIAHTSIEIAQIKKLLYAVRTSDYGQVRRICEKGINNIVNYNDPTDGETALLIAVKKNDELMMRCLLDYGAHPDVIDFKGRTPLMHAASRGFVEAVQTLLNANANIDIQDTNGNDILFACLSDGTLRQQKCFSSILSKCTSNFNSVNSKGKPVLVAACENGIVLEKFCLMLLERGADVNVIDKETGRTPLHAACASGSVKVVRELLKRHADVNARDKQQRTPAHDAVMSKVFELLPILSAYNARFDLADQSLNTPVHQAAMLDQGKSIKFMVQRGGSLKARNAQNQLPIKIARMLKNKNARKQIRFVDKKHYHRKFVLSKSNPYRDYKIHFYDWLQERYDRLLRRFHQVEDPSTHRIASTDFKRIIHEEGFTEITSDDLNELIVRHETKSNEIDYQLLLSGKLFVEKSFLLKAFAQKKKKKKQRKQKRTKKQVAIPIAVRHEGPRTSNGNPSLIYVRKHEFSTDLNRFNRDRPPQHIISDDSAYYIDKKDPQFIHINNAVYRGDLHTLHDAFKSGVPVDIRDKFYKTPLMVAAASGDYETTKFLLQYGANVHLEDNFKWTALHHAAYSGQLSVVRLLIDAGAKVNHESLTLATPLSRAIENSSLNIINYLIEKRADIRHENIMQRNLLDLARDFATPQVLHRIQTAYEQRGRKNRRSVKSRARRKSRSKSKRNKNVTTLSTSIKPVTLEVSLPRRGSLLAAEKKLQSLNNACQSITYHPLTKWTEQPTTKELLQKKINLRNDFTMAIDFPDYKLPLIANAQAKIERLQLSNERRKPS